MGVVRYNSIWLILIMIMILRIDFNPAKSPAGNPA